jgi:hypothetical protein
MKKTALLLSLSLATSTVFASDIAHYKFCLQNKTGKTVYLSNINNMASPVVNNPNIPSKNWGLNPTTDTPFSVKHSPNFTAQPNNNYCVTISNVSYGGPGVAFNYSLSKDNSTATYSFSWIINNKAVITKPSLIYGSSKESLLSYDSSGLGPTQTGDTSSTQLIITLPSST